MSASIIRRTDNFRACHIHPLDCNVISSITTLPESIRPETVAILDYQALDNRKSRKKGDNHQMSTKPKLESKKYDVAPS